MSSTAETLVRILAQAVCVCVVLGWIALWTLLGAMVGKAFNRSEFCGAIGFLLSLAHVVFIIAGTVEALNNSPNR